jgi:hypothetical protein
MPTTYFSLNINERINFKNQFAASVNQGFYHYDCTRSNGVLHKAVSAITSNIKLWNNYFKVH